MMSLIISSGSMSQSPTHISWQQSGKEWENSSFLHSQSALSSAADLDSSFSYFILSPTHCGFHLVDGGSTSASNIPRVYLGLCKSQQLGDLYRSHHLQQAHGISRQS